MIFSSCSSYVRDLISKTTEGYNGDVLTIFLPDFAPDTVKNLLSLLYTGTFLNSYRVDNIHSSLDIYNAIEITIPFEKDRYSDRMCSCASSDENSLYKQ